VLHGRSSTGASCPVASEIRPARFTLDPTFPAIGPRVCARPPPPLVRLWVATRRLARWVAARKPALRRAAVQRLTPLRGEVSRHVLLTTSCQEHSTPRASWQRAAAIAGECAHHRLRVLLHLVGSMVVRTDLLIIRESRGAFMVAAPPIASC
jgi:hypothetical protein